VSTDAGSVPFDRAADFYDETRSYTEETHRATTALLAAELRDRGRVLEVGVGTGLIALPLHAAGIPMLGLDLSAPMMAKLVEKGEGEQPFSLVRGDATALPLRDDAVGAGVVRWVLHLISNWRAVVAELIRVIRPGGVLVVHLGSYGGPWDEIHRRFTELSGMELEPVGLGWHREPDLDTEVARHGGSLRLLPALHEHTEEPLEEFLAAIRDNHYSWTWPLSDDVRLCVLQELRPWTEERFGPLDRAYAFDTEIVWRAYDLA
jgi:SAM-dependent methyltransferase